MLELRAENGYIKNIDQYLSDITERQTLILTLQNDTKRNGNETSKWLKRLNEKFEIP